MCFAAKRVQAGVCIENQVKADGFCENCQHLMREILVEGKYGRRGGLMSFK